MPNFTWKSCTSGSTTLSQLLSRLSQCPPHLTPLSDLRLLFITTACYLTLITLLHHHYKKGPPSFAYTRPFINLAAIHNLFLSLWSLIMNIGSTFAIIHIWRTQGPPQTICTNIHHTPMPSSFQFWLYMFFVSKFYELFDTVLLLLRGRPLTVLHVWHHASVMYETWGWLESNVTLAIYGMWFNTFVHVFMYAYYAACLFKIPFPLKKAITTTQIVQFVSSFFFLVPFSYLHWTGPGCTGVTGLAFSAFINASYLALFARFFRNTYSARRKKDTTSSGQVSEASKTE